MQLREWPHQENCVMYNGLLETGLHLYLLFTLLPKLLGTSFDLGTLRCGTSLAPFAKIVWNQVLTWEHFDVELV